MYEVIVQAKEGLDWSYLVSPRFELSVGDLIIVPVSSVGHDSYIRNSYDTATVLSINTDLSKHIEKGTKFRWVFDVLDYSYMSNPVTSIDRENLPVMHYCTDDSCTGGCGLTKTPSLLN